MFWGRGAGCACGVVWACFEPAWQLHLTSGFSLQQLVRDRYEVACDWSGRAAAQITHQAAVEACSFMIACQTCQFHMVLGMLTCCAEMPPHHGSSLLIVELMSFSGCWECGQTL